MIQRLWRYWNLILEVCLVNVQQLSSQQSAVQRDGWFRRKSRTFAFAKHGLGHSFNPKDPKKFQSYLYSVEDMASLSSETMQTIPFDPRWPKTGFNFSIKLFHHSCNKTFFIRTQVPQPKPDKKLLAELRRLPPLSEAEGSQFQEIIYNQLIPKKIKGEDYEPCNFFAKNFQTVCPNAWIEKWNDQREKVNITFDFLRLWQVRCAFVYQTCLSQLDWPIASWF